VRDWLLAAVVDKARPGNGDGDLRAPVEIGRELLVQLRDRRQVSAAVWNISSAQRSLCSSVIA
jgi:hypothetical protein